VQEGKKKLAAEVQALKDNVQKEIDKILEAKEVSVLLNNLLFKYEVEINNQRESQFKIADEVTLKNLLKEKLYKEIQGFRTSSSDYEELNKVKPEDINDVITQIKHKLG
jgi:predicted house-cleaning noncanonical NTP pyrophosphatase (MazG superfamily)